MELHQIRYFLAVSQERSFTRAAKFCGVSQPSLTNAIKKLEQEFGGDLFRRGSSQSVLSDLGRAILPHLRQVSRCVDDARLAATHHPHSSSIKGAGITNGGSYAETFKSRHRDRAHGPSGNIPVEATNAHSRNGAP